MNINSYISKYNLLNLHNVNCMFSGLTTWYWVINGVLFPGEVYFFHSLNHNKLPGTTTPRVQEQHAHPGSKHILMELKTNQRELRPGTRNLANYPGLDHRSWRRTYNHHFIKPA